MTRSSVPAGKAQEVLALFTGEEEVRATLRQHGRDIELIKQVMRANFRAPGEVIHPRAAPNVSDARTRLLRALGAMEAKLEAGDYVSLDASKLTLKQELMAVCRELESLGSPARHLASLAYDAVRWTRTGQVRVPMLEAIRASIDAVLAPWSESAFATARRQLLQSGWLVAPPGDLEEDCLS